MKAVPISAEALARVRALDRDALDESDMTATLREPRAMHPKHGNWPSGWKP